MRWEGYLRHLIASLEILYCTYYVFENDTTFMEVYFQNV